jgi:hypothetical protein
MGADPAASVQQITSGDYRARCLHFIVGLGVADAPHGTYATVPALAEAVRDHPHGQDGKGSDKTT